MSDDRPQRGDIRESLDHMALRLREFRRRADMDPAIARRVHEVIGLQSGLLAEMYGDLRRQERYQPAIDFFLSDLYGPHDFSLRDTQMLRALETFKRLLPTGALDALAAAFELQLLSVELDMLTAGELPDASATDIGAYGRAYRAVGRREARTRQIVLVGRIGRLLDSLAQRRDVGMMVHLARRPAQLAGFGALQDFVERGYDAFRRMHGAEEFLAIIDQRQRSLMQRLFAGAIEKDRP